MPDDGRQRDALSATQVAAEKDLVPRWRIGIGRLARTTVFLAIASVAIVAAARWGYFQWSHITEIDARIVADMVVVSSRVSGWVVERPVEEGESVARGDLLVAIDARDPVLQVAEVEAQIAGLAAERDRLTAERSILEATTTSRLRAARSRAEAMRVAVRASGEQQELARAEHDRVNALRADNIVSQRRVDEVRIELSRATERHLTAQAELAEAEAAVAEAEAALDEILLLDRRREMLRQERAEMIARRDRLTLDVADRTIRSPIDGVVSQVFVDVGEYVSPGQRLLLTHDPQAIRIETNIKETELRHIAPGMPVVVHIDAFPDREFEGTIKRIGQAATSEFALLPNPNPSGNFTKVTQRLPVRIAIDQQDGMLRPGMMVVVEIAIPGR